MTDKEDPPIKKTKMTKKGAKAQAPPQEGGFNIPGFNLAGRPDKLKRTEGALKRNEVKAVGPYHTSNVNTETFWHFNIRSSKNEWIRFNRHSASFLLYGTYDNPNRDAAHALPERAAERHALRAGSNTPGMFVDPSVLGTGFVDRIDVSINNVPVPTNTTVGKLLLQYVRMASIFNTRPGPLFATSSDVAFGANRAANKEPMKVASEPFDYYTYDCATGARVPIFLDGIFPFDFKNRTIESIDREKEQSLFFPPDTEIDIKIHVHPSKIESIFHNECHLARYFDMARNADRPGGNLRLSIQEVTMEYESAELTAAEHVRALKQYMEGGLGIYDYDIVRGQNQPLTSDASFTVNSFQVMPQARLAYIMFLPDFATFPQEITRKPLSGLSRFPANSSNLSIDFAGEPNIITPNFINFGHQSENHQISKKIYYDYLVRNNMTSCKFEDFFPRSADEYSLIQCFVLDLKNYMSDRTEMLTIRSTYTGGTSPARIQVVCLTVHPNGRATCRSSGTQFEWIWNFSLLS